MTRINLVSPSLLCDQHLLAEHREITRIPNHVLRRLSQGKPVVCSLLDDYTLGEGHVRFFYDKLEWLKRRYDAVHHECQRRGFKVTHIWPELNGVPAKYRRGYEITEAALRVSAERIAAKMPKGARFSMPGF
jgi:hypothetical protein